MNLVEDNNENKKTILIVDDEKPIVEILVYNLQKEGYNTLEANDGISAVDIALSKKPDLILLDIMLPKLDGLAVCKKIRHVLNVPILMLTAKDEEIDKILGLELGADDYVTKPFSVRELMARIKANLRKVEATIEQKDKNDENETEENKIVVGDLALDLDKFEVKVKDKVIDLTLREFEVLKYLAGQPGQVVTRENLLEKDRSIFSGIFVSSSFVSSSQDTKQKVKDKRSNPNKIFVLMILNFCNVFIF